jgi:hypothetical protein
MYLTFARNSHGTLRTSSTNGLQWRYWSIGGGRAPFYLQLAALVVPGQLFELVSETDSSDAHRRAGDERLSAGQPTPLGRSASERDQVREPSARRNGVSPGGAHRGDGL